MVSILLHIVYLFVLSVISLIPTVHLPTEISTALAEIGVYIKYANNFFPMTTAFEVIGA